MKRIIILLLFSSVSVLAAPPIVPPAGLMAGQIIAHRQGIDLTARQSAAQNVVGSRSDEYSTQNIGSGQARAVFNNTVMSASNQFGYQSTVTPNTNLSSTYKEFLKNQVQMGASSLTAPTPFATRVEKSQTQGMIFLKPLINSAPIIWRVTMELNKPMRPSAMPRNGVDDM